MSLVYLPDTDRIINIDHVSVFELSPVPQPGGRKHDFPDQSADTPPAQPMRIVMTGTGAPIVLKGNDALAMRRALAKFTSMHRSRLLPPGVGFATGEPLVEPTLHPTERIGLGPGPLLPGDDWPDDSHFEV